MHYIRTKTILSSKNGMNLYRGCTHGCIYCDSRSTCYQMEHAFEDIAVKENAIPLLARTLQRKRKKCMISTGSMTDPYLPLEKELGYVRQALGLIDTYGFGFTLITKSDLVLRDIDLLAKINSHTKCVVQMTLTTFDDALCRKLEPHVCPTSRRFEVLAELRDAGIPTVVWLCPILPFLNDTIENLDGLLDFCRRARVYGILNFGMGVTLREGSREYFYRQLDRLFPGLKDRYIRTYGQSYILNSPHSPELLRFFHQTCEDCGIVHDKDAIFSYLTEFEQKDAPVQLCMWDD